MGELVHFPVAVTVGSFEEVFEPLELVEDDEVGLEAVHADSCEQVTQFADHHCEFP